MTDQLQAIFSAFFSGRWLTSGKKANTNVILQVQLGSFFYPKDSELSEKNALKIQYCDHCVGVIRFPQIQHHFCVSHQPTLRVGNI